MRLVFVLVALISAFVCFGQKQANTVAIAKNDSILIYSDLSDFRIKIIVDTIVLYGNKTTHRSIILRELTFLQSYTISSFEFYNKLSRSRENLLNTSLFNFVTMHDSVISGSGFAHVQIHIQFIERWYLWPIPIFEISDRNFNTWWETKDFNRISYGLLLKKENMRGRMETLNMLFRFGWDETYQISYNIPYINKKQTFGSGFGMGFSQNHEVAYKTVENKPVNVRDNDENIYKRFYSYLNITHRPSFNQYHGVQLSYNYYVFGDTLLQLNPDYSFNGNTVNEYLTINYRYTNDHRDSKVYPLNGDYFEGLLTKSGFGILKDGDISMMDISGSYRKYWNISKKLYFATDWTGKISTSRNQPYFYQQGLGYGRNFVRGYELYVVDGQSYGLSKNTLKYNLVPTRVKEIGFIPSEKFSMLHYALYVNWYLDVGYVDDFKNTEGNDLANQILFGTGLGLDLVTYYDMVFRVEFSVNSQGEFGVFFHVANTL